MSASDSNQPIPFILKIVLIQLSSVVSELVTFPIDFVKTRMQFNQKKVNILSTIKDVIKTEGGFGFYRGLSPAVLRHWIYTASRIFLYEDFRNRKVLHSKEGELNFLGKFIIGGFSGGIGQFIASPADIMKVQMVIDRKLNNPPKYNGILDCFIQLYKSNGIKGFWKGVWPNVNRAIAVNLGELATYDLAKTNIMLFSGLPDDIRIHTLSSISSGLIASLCSTPFDVLKTRIMAGNYKNSWNCAKLTFQNEGFLAFYKGFIPCWARLGPWQFCFWVTYEQLRTTFGYKGF